MNNNEILTQDAKTWGMLSHLSTFLGFVIPFGNIIAPLIIWLSKKQESEFVADQAKEVLNFQLSILLFFAICFFIALVSVFGSHIFSNLMLLMVVLGAAWIFDLIVTIIGAMRANEGIRYRYPVSVRFIK